MLDVTAVLRRLGRDYTYVLPGLPVAIFSFSLLLSLVGISLATLIVWIGALLLPLTLMVASGFAELGRNRLRRWGAAVAPVSYRRADPGILGTLSLVLDARRWLDLVFEMLIALPLRLVTFVIAVGWSVAGPAGLTYFLWSLFIPDDGPVTTLLQLTNPNLVPQSGTAQYLLDAGVHLLIGVVFLSTLSMVMRGLAGFDAMLATALLGGGDRGVTLGHQEGAAAAEAAESADADPHQPVVSFSPWAWSWIGAGFTAVVLLAVGWPVTAGLYDVAVGVAMAIVAAHCAAIVITLRWAWAGLGLSLMASGAMMTAAAAAGVAVWPWPVTTMITQCAVLVVAALARPWYYAASAWGAGAVLTLVALLVYAPDEPGGTLATGIVFVSVSAAVVTIGVLVQLWIRNAGQLQEATRSSAEQGRRRHELEERNRIARELHDVVAHSMSVISVQAATAQYRNPNMDEAARGEFTEIAESSRQALSEMRMLLTILRGGDEARTAPEPGLADIDALIDTTRSSGTTIRHSPADESLAGLTVSSPTGLVAYRTVQEALSNALRHAPGAAVDVEVGIAGSADGPRLLTIAVRNGAPPKKSVDPAPGAGFGLTGLRERIEAVGGSVKAGPTTGGGFAVRAMLPL